MHTPETQQRIAEFRQLARENKLSTEQYKEAIALLRGDRKSASTTSDKAKTTKAKAKAVVNSEDLLSQLEGL
jgi:hypothetical protein